MIKQKIKPSELLNKPEKWTRHAAARDENYCHVDPTSKKAVSFCLIGALIRCAKNDKDYETAHNKIYSYLQINYNLAGANGLANYNDNHQYKDVIKILKACNL